MIDWILSFFITESDAYAIGKTLMIATCIHASVCGHAIVAREGWGWFWSFHKWVGGLAVAACVIASNLISSLFEFFF